MRTLILILLLTSCTPVTHQHKLGGFTESAGLNDSSVEAIELCRQVVYTVGIQGYDADPDTVMAWCLWRAGVSI